MAKAKKLPSGQWRTLVYSHTDTNGKRHYESFTANTRKESEFRAAEFLMRKGDFKKPRDMTLGEAMEGFLSNRSNVLSPSTLRSYQNMAKNRFTALNGTHLSKLNNALLQKWVNELSIGRSPKTVHNVYGLLTAVLGVYLPGREFSIRLPDCVKFESNVPTDADVGRLIAYYREKDPDMYIASCLAAFGSLRRSEICPLEAVDVKEGCILVRKAMVETGQGGYTVKLTNKTKSSNRVVPMPEAIIEELPRSGRLVNLTPSQVSNRHRRTLQRLGIPTFRFHDLRHYTASIMHAIGIPDQYIMQRGGWSSDFVLKSIYRGIINDYKDTYTETALNHFDKVFKDATRNATQK